VTIFQGIISSTDFTKYKKWHCNKYRSHWKICIENNNNCKYIDNRFRCERRENKQKIMKLKIKGVTIGFGVKNNERESESVNGLVEQIY
jgi:hypothetical protein